MVGIHLCGGDLGGGLGGQLGGSLSHFALVRLAMQISVNTSGTWQHLWMATEATPPQPMIRTLLISVTPLSVSCLFTVCPYT